jgi:hypothetical protein
MNTRARFTGRPESPATTRPVIRPVGVGAASLFCEADVSRDGDCGRAEGGCDGGCCAETATAHPNAIPSPQVSRRRSMCSIRQKIGVAG